MPDDFATLFNEEDCQRRITRAERVLDRGHHSVAGHVYYTFVIENAPKIVAMMLNNERIYDTSEKSGRYTTMRTMGFERELYEKWQKKFAELIAREYPTMSQRQIGKLALENARLLISVFTPATTMVYTANLRQLNYLISYCEDFLANIEDDMASAQFFKALAPVIEELRDKLVELVGVENLTPPPAFNRFSLFNFQDRVEDYGETYTTNYLGSFAQLAQAQRHRTLAYEMRLVETEDPGSKFYLPPILEKYPLVHTEYLEDINKIAFPQGMLVEINERGLFEDFVRKCGERLCGEAQLEICRQTDQTLSTYASALEAKYRGGVRRGFGREQLKDKINILRRMYFGETRCVFNKYPCKQACFWGPQSVWDRVV